MPSPFPGMDPWLESPGVFPDLHSSFATDLRAALTKVLPAPFFAAISMRFYMEESGRRTEPDVDLLTRSSGSAIESSSGGTATATRPRACVFEKPALPWPDEEITESFVEVRTTGDGERLITSIEILSPTNKTRGANGRGLYLAKQQEMRMQGVNLVEIDLLRAGAHATAAPLVEMRRRIGPYDYHVCVVRADRGKSRFVTPIRLAAVLPSIDIPLTQEVNPVSVELQPVLTQCYDEAGYARRVHYDRACEPPLTPEQSAWAEGVLREKGLLK
jgi:Protein of unknown function (DUF4058)